MSMRISYIPETILKARVDCKFFMRGPFSAAIYNFKMSCHASHIKEHDKFQEKVAKVQEVAKPVIEGTQRTSKISLCNRVAHFLAHVCMGILLFIPILNFIPFVILNLKAKELPALPPSEEKSQSEELHEESQSTEELLETPSSITTENPKTEVITSTQVQTPKVEPQKQTPVSTPTQPRFKITTIQDTPSKVPGQAKVLTKEPEDPVLKNRHHPTVETVPGSPASKVREHADVIIDLFFPIFVSEIPAEALRDISTYYSMIEKTIQPKKLPEKKIQEFFKLEGWLDKKNLTHVRTKFRDNINSRITGSFGTTPAKKLQNVQSNLKHLRQFLNEKFTKYPNSPLMSTYNGQDPRVQTPENPYDRVLRGVFGLSNEEFKELLPKLKFYQNNGLIYVNPNILGSS